MNIICPECKKNRDVTDELPERACDETEIECERCETVMQIGWYGVAEVRDWTKKARSDE